jgi:hypothetical protein
MSELIEQEKFEELSGKIIEDIHSNTDGYINNDNCEVNSNSNSNKIEEEIRNDCEMSQCKDLINKELFQSN